MQLRIVLSKGPIGSTRWSLVVTFRDGSIKEFYLGQDIKFIRRILGYDESDFFEMLGIVSKKDNRSLKWNDKISQRIANFIKRDLELTPKILRKLEIWELSGE